MIFGLLSWIVVIYIIVKLCLAHHNKIHRWLQHELPLWENKNIITPDQGNAILGIYKLKRSPAHQKMDMVKVLTLVGAIFLGLGIIFFVASNWQRIPAHIRTMLLLGVSIATLYTAYHFSYEREGFTYLGESLFLLAALFWGGSIALIGQIYNIPVSDNWYILLLWVFPILPIAVFFKNDYTHILASILLIIWNFLYSESNYTANYYYLFIVLAIMLPTAKKIVISRWLNLLGLVTTSIYCCFMGYDWLALLISAGLLGYYLYQKKERVYLYTANLAFIFWAIAFLVARPLQFNPYFVLPAGFILYLTYRDNVKENLVISLLGLMTWLNLILVSFSQACCYEFSFIDFLIFQSFLAIVIYTIGVISKERGYQFVAVYKIFGYIVSFICVYLLSFRSLLEAESQSLNPVYLYASVAAFASAALLIFDEMRCGHFRDKAGRLELISLCAALLAGSVFLINTQTLTLNTIVVNTALLIFALANISLGVELKRPALFTTGVVIFALFIITRYIDMGWKLREKSLFFIIGGLIILFLGTFLEKQRRAIIERMKTDA